MPREGSSTPPLSSGVSCGCFWRWTGFRAHVQHGAKARKVLGKSSKPLLPSAHCAHETPGLDPDPEPAMLLRYSTSTFEWDF